MEDDNDQFLDDQNKTLNYTLRPDCQPIVHASVELLPCDVCQSENKEFNLYDPECLSCQEFLSRANASECFALLRQWVKQVQKSAGIIITTLINNGANPNDRDGLSDMTPLHYAVKSGVSGMDDPLQSAKTVRFLLNKGANPFIRCHWTNMAAIHYASYFDNSLALEVLLKETKGVDVNCGCTEFDNGTPLHIAARTMSLNSAKVLLKYGADPSFADTNGNLPIDWLPCQENINTASLKQNYDHFVELLKNHRSSKLNYNFGQPQTVSRYKQNITTNGSPRDVPSLKEYLKKMDVHVGDRVIVSGLKIGILRYCGPTLFSKGLWAGIELDEPVGKNDGTIEGISYFNCRPNHGIFAPLSKITKMVKRFSKNTSNPDDDDDCTYNQQDNACHTTSLLDLRQLTNKLKNLSTETRWEKKIIRGESEKEDDSSNAYKDNNICDEFSATEHRRLEEGSNGGDSIIQIGNKVSLGNGKLGIVRFVGKTQFAAGNWYGVELADSLGKNNGTVDGIKYFSCNPNHGIFVPEYKLKKYSEDENLRDNDKKISNSIHSSNFEIYPKVGIQRKVNSLPRYKTKYNFSKRSMSVDNKLVEGMHVLCNGEIGIICYKGLVDFAEGLWLGIELKVAKGNHDGFVKGRRYFTCKPMHGLLVRPSKVFVKGINASKLLT